MDLSGKLALVTGGGRGIGEAIAVRLAGHGARVVVTGRTQAQIDKVAADIGGVAIRCDLSDRSDTDTMVAQVRELGRVDVLVNNAGIAGSSPIAKATDEDWDRIMEVNAAAPFRLCRAFIPAMIEAGWGRVVNIASNAGVSGYRYTTAYCASKHAVVGMTRSLAVELATTGVTINAVCPGWVDTDMVAEAVERIAEKTSMDEDGARKALASMGPQKRILTADEVAHTTMMLLDHDARGIHGQAIVIDGGALLK